MVDGPGKVLTAISYPAGKDLFERARRSPTVWVLTATLVPALIFTPLARIWYPESWKLVGYFWYSIPANTFVYLPHEPAVLYAGAIYDPWIVAVVGGISTLVASIVDYLVVKRVFQLKRVAPIKQTRIYRAAVRGFYWRPWLTIAAVAISPFPYAPIRILAPSSNYPLWRYVSANLTGRVPRYYLLAMGAAWVPVPYKYLVLMVVGLLIIPVVVALWVRWKARSSPEVVLQRTDN